MCLACQHHVAPHAQHSTVEAVVGWQALGWHLPATPAAFGQGTSLHRQTALSGPTHMAVVGWAGPCCTATRTRVYRCRACCCLCKAQPSPGTWIWHGTARPPCEIFAQELRPLAPLASIASKGVKQSGCANKQAGSCSTNSCWHTTALTTVIQQERMGVLPCTRTRSIAPCCAVLGHPRPPPLRPAAPRHAVSHAPA